MIEPFGKRQKKPTFLVSHELILFVYSLFKFFYSLLHFIIFFNFTAK